MPRWFRRQEESATEKKEASAPQAAAPPKPAETARPAQAGAKRPQRRRGSRGGRGRSKKPGEQPQRPEGAPEKKPEGGATQPSQAAERRASQQRRDRGGRRRQAPRRAPLPAAKRELLVSVDAGERRVAVLEDEKVAEVYLERPDHHSIAGNVYKGVVDNVLPGMEAAFVEIGLEKNGFLYVDEIVIPELEGRGQGRKIQELIQRGQEILVQAVKDPMKTKGARLTTDISLPGRFVVFVPNGEGLGVSRRLPDEERSRLREIVKALERKKGGIIVRTAAEGASAEDIERDLVFLERLWKSIQDRAKRVKAPSLVYQEAELPLRVTRDLFTGDFERAARRSRSHLQAHRRLSQEDLAAHGRASRPLQGARRRSSSPTASMPRSARPSRAGSTCLRAATSSSTTPRPSPSSTSTPAASSARAPAPPPRASRTRSPRTTSRRSRRSCASCVCATSAASSSSTSSTWPTRRTGPPSRRRFAASSSATAPRPTWSRSRRSGWWR